MTSKFFEASPTREPQTRRLKRVDLDNEGLPSPITWVWSTVWSCDHRRLDSHARPFGIEVPSPCRSKRWCSPMDSSWTTAPPTTPRSTMSSSQPFQPSSPIAGGDTRRRKSRFIYRHLAQLALSSTNCPLRVIAHVDLDAFYAQCEMVRLDVAEDQPLAVQQWYQTSPLSKDKS